MELPTVLRKKKIYRGVLFGMLAGIVFMIAFYFLPIFATYQPSEVVSLTDATENQKVIVSYYKNWGITTSAMSDCYRPLKFYIKLLYLIPLFIAVFEIAEQLWNREKERYRGIFLMIASVMNIALVLYTQHFMVPNAHEIYGARVRLTLLGGIDILISVLLFGCCLYVSWATEGKLSHSEEQIKAKYQGVASLGELE